VPVPRVVRARWRIIVSGGQRELHEVAEEVVSASKEFPGYSISTQRTYGGVSLVAVRRNGTEQPGVYAVITGDLAELRSVLDAEPR
jgi:hypothetical protein